MVKDQLNAEEREILEKYERDELRPATRVDREMAIAPQAARNTLKKTRRVNLWVTDPRSTGAATCVKPGIS